MEREYSVAIVGGGASGLMCAVELVRLGMRGENIAILEKNDRVGKKLLATGNGQGNLCNAFFGDEYYHGESEFVHAFTEKAKKIDIEKYLSDFGIPLIADANGRKYPISKQASSVSDIIRAYLTENGVKEITSFNVDKIIKKGNNFLICSGEREVFSKTVVLSCGGKASKQFGTDGTAYSLATRLGHKLTELYPSLVHIKTEKEKIKGLKGLKERALVVAYDGEKELKRSVGDIIFTDYGVSGNTVFNLSGYLVSSKDPKIKISFLPEYTLDQTAKILADREKFPYVKTAGVLCGIVNKKIGECIIKSAKSARFYDLAYAIKNFELKVTGSLGFDYAQVTKGGIDTCDIDSDSFESKLQKGLYIVGEELNVDGDCGGYNLTFAFVSAIICARHIFSVL